MTTQFEFDRAACAARRVMLEAAILAILRENSEDGGANQIDIMATRESSGEVVIDFTLSRGGRPISGESL